MPKTVWVEMTMTEAHAQTQMLKKKPNQQALLARIYMAMQKSKGNK